MYSFFTGISGCRTGTNARGPVGIGRFRVGDVEGGCSLGDWIGD